MGIKYRVTLQGHQIHQSPASESALSGGTGTSGRKCSLNPNERQLPSQAWGTRTVSVPLLGLSIKQSHQTSRHNGKPAEGPEGVERSQVRGLGHTRGCASHASHQGHPLLLPSSDSSALSELLLGGDLAFPVGFQEQARGHHPRSPLLLPHQANTLRIPRGLRTLTSAGIAPSPGPAAGHPGQLSHHPLWESLLNPGWWNTSQGPASPLGNISFIDSLTLIHLSRC